ncbi:hypothetical protein T439DRAFT_382491 [Meredithblackwellia eburnea MCA 4105]
MTSMLLQSPLPGDLMVLITDTLESEATMLLTTAITTNIRKTQPASTTLLLALAHPFNHYASILKKNASPNGLQLQNEKEKGSFSFLEIDPTASDKQQLLDSIFRATLDFLAASAKPDSTAAPSPPLVILDDVSALLWSGIDALRLARFVGTLRGLCSEYQSSLIILQHGDDLAALDNSEDNVLFRRLLQRADVWLNTASLSSQTRGELSIHRGPALVLPIDKFDVGERHAATAVQYKLEDQGPAWFNKGLGRGFI